MSGVEKRNRVGDAQTPFGKTGRRCRGGSVFSSVQPHSNCVTNARRGVGGRKRGLASGQSSLTLIKTVRMGGSKIPDNGLRVPGSASASSRRGRHPYGQGGGRHSSVERRRCREGRGGGLRSRGAACVRRAPSGGRAAVEHRGCGEARRGREEWTNGALAPARCAPLALPRARPPRNGDGVPQGRAGATVRARAPSRVVRRCGRPEQRRCWASTRTLVGAKREA